MGLLFEEDFFEEGGNGWDVVDAEGAGGEEEADAGRGLAGDEGDDTGIEEGVSQVDGSLEGAVVGGEGNHGADAVGAVEEAGMAVTDGL